MNEAYFELMKFVTESSRQPAWFRWFHRKHFASTPTSLLTRPIFGKWPIWTHQRKRSVSTVSLKPGNGRVSACCLRYIYTVYAQSFKIKWESIVVSIVCLSNTSIPFPELLRTFVNLTMRNKWTQNKSDLSLLQLQKLRETRSTRRSSVWKQHHRFFLLSGHLIHSWTKRKRPLRTTLVSTQRYICQDLLLYKCPNLSLPLPSHFSRMRWAQLVPPDSSRLWMSAKF